MRQIKFVLAVLLAPVLIANAATLPGDTVSVAFSDAAQHWLHGHLKVTERSLRLLAAHSTLANELASAKVILLDEFYFWPEKYRQYLHLADSLDFRTGMYETAKLLAEQPSLQIQLTGDSLQIPFALKNKAHVVVTVMINGKPVRLAVDSGAQRTFISNRTARKIGIRQLADVQIENYNQKSVPGSTGMADSLRLDGLMIRNLPVLVSSIPMSGVDGLLGWELMRQFVVVIDYPNRRLTLRKSTPDSTLNANLLGGSLPMLLLPGPANSSLLLQLDTGSNEYLRLSPLGLTKIGPYRTGSKLGISSSTGQLVRIRWGKYAKKLALDVNGKSQEFRRSFFFDTDGMIGMFVRDGLIGGRAFRKGKLTLDALNHHYEYVSE